jgi:PPOX class probable F420-dependent enzyme
VPEQVPPEFDDFLAESRNAILCIPRGVGAAQEAPHATPVWFDYAGGRFQISITRRRVKYRLLQDAPQVTLVVDDAPSYRTVVVSGPAEILDDDASLLALRKRLRAKYGYDFGESELSDDEVLRSLRDEGRVVVSITPEQVLSWAGG